MGPPGERRTLGCRKGEGLIRAPHPQVAWDSAERVSFAEGFEFTDRDGARQNIQAGPSGFAEAVLEEYSLL